MWRIYRFIYGVPLHTLQLCAWKSMTPSPLPSTSFSRSRIMPSPKVSSTWRSKQCTGASHSISQSSSFFVTDHFFAPTYGHVNVNNGCSRKTHCFSQPSNLLISQQFTRGIPCYPLVLDKTITTVCLGVVEHHLQLILGDFAITVPWASCDA